ncbi:uncharacterized protein isoform X2 [Leptinotarsa decemlineata]|uniref:uncharacterized protein isoform X2 n=1 Tax=Leptinotarsa decemlineata TaxID=7539 RepID=UPI003D306E7F
MSRDTSMKQKIGVWIPKILEEEKFEDYHIVIENDGIIGGHLSSLICARIVGTTSDNQIKEVSIVVKYNIRNSVKFLKVAFEREIFCYEKLIPVFIKFQHDFKIQEDFISVPKCYQTSSCNDQTVIVLENLKKRGYQLYDRMEPMNLDHQKVVLREYAKLHAVSLAMRDQNYEQFKNLHENLSNVSKLYFQEDSTVKILTKYMKCARDILLRRNEMDLVKELDWILENGPTNIILDTVLNDRVDHCVVVHGDSWNNNIMFKYKPNETKPTKLAIIDWQLASMHSPILDLSLFIYTVSSQEELSHFEELITYYYSALTDFLRELGSDAEKLFPFSVLKEHWYKYAIFPMIWIMTFLRIILEEDSDGRDKEDMFDISFNEEEYEKRMIAVLKHYFCFKFTK